MKDHLPCPMRVNLGICEVCLLISLLTDLKKKGNQYKKYRLISGYSYFIRKGAFYLEYPASRGFSLVFLSVVLPFSSRFWLLAFCFGCFCAEEKTCADSRLGFLLSMRIRHLQDLGGNHMTKPVVEPVLSTRASFLY